MNCHTFVILLKFYRPTCHVTNFSCAISKYLVSFKCCSLYFHGELDFFSAQLVSVHGYEWFCFHSCVLFYCYFKIQLIKTLIMKLYRIGCFIFLRRFGKFIFLKNYSYQVQKKGNQQKDCRSSVCLHNQLVFFSLPHCLQLRKSLWV